MEQGGNAAAVCVLCNGLGCRPKLFFLMVSFEGTLSRCVCSGLGFRLFGLVLNECCRGVCVAV